MPDQHGTPTLREILAERGSDETAINLVLAWRGADGALLTDQQAQAKDLVRRLWPDLYEALEYFVAGEMFRGSDLPTEGFEDFISWVRGGSPWEHAD